MNNGNGIKVNNGSLMTTREISTDQLLTGTRKISQPWGFIQYKIANFS